MRNDERAADIVGFWHAVEMFSPQQVPRPVAGKPNGHGSVLDLEADELAPWQPGHPFSERPLPPGKTRIFTVYGGLYDISNVRRELERLFGADGMPADGRRSGHTAMFALTVDADGYLVENSANLSACAWAMSRLNEPGPDDPRWLDGFQPDERAFVAALNKLSPPRLSGGDAGTGAPASFGARVGEAVSARVKSAARDAWGAGAQATGAAVNAAVAGAGALLAGPFVGGIAGEVVGTFVEKLLSPADPSDSAPDRTDPRAPRLDLTAAALHEFVQELAEALGIEGLGVAGVRVECVVLSTKTAEKPNQQAFLNSFIADDLARIANEVRTGQAGDALAAYLSSDRDIRTDKRIDVREGRSAPALVDGVAPVRLPGGRWPAGPERSLVVSQQFAVNQILGEFRNQAGVFSVNGPPGTGKTTMLRDVLAGLVVERARVLAELDDPLDAFTDVLQEVQLGPRYRVPVRAVRPALTGFEVVLATATNDAAENVTAEIPGVRAVAGAADDALAAGYFPELASHILDDNAWGLVAAVLGNMGKRGEFVERFWWSDDIGMQAVLRRVRHDRAAVDDWGEAINRFRQAEQKVGELAMARQRVAEAIQEVRHWSAEMPRLEAALVATRTACEQHNATVARLDAWCRQAHDAYAARDRDYQDHLRHKPGFWVSLSTWFKAGRDWAERHTDLAKLRDAARSDFDRLQADAARARAALTEAQLQWHQLEQALTRAKASAAAAQGRVENGRAQWPGNVPPDDLTDEQALQLCAPWADEEICAARTSLFLEALRLHKAFLFNAEAHARGNLGVIAEVLKRRVDVRPEALRAAWQTLFLVVPMISTTFASLPRLFGDLGREALGWLVIDEAGQAAPQQAAGGLWRCRRAVIVGDPQQLEPIVTLPLPAQHALRRHHGVDEEWTPDGTSAQRVADRLARFGTYLPEPEGEHRVWVGAPLRVHRRCDRPMFDISNRVAYGGDLMIYGTAEREAYPGANAWIDVRFPQADGNWVPEEGRALRALLREFSDAGISPVDVRVISPFRRVVSGCKDVASGEFGWQFARENVGTVHTVQGQESDVIVLVLGTGPGNVGPRSWAAQKPNLLNVAVSRAKRRLYVIGNHESWRSQPHFRVLAHSLPVQNHNS